MQNLALSNELIGGELEGLSPSKADQLKAIYYPMIEAVQGFEKSVNELMSEEHSEEKARKAKVLRLDIAKMRIKADKARKELKQQSLLEGRAIDGTCNTFKNAVVPMEEALKEVENYEERQEQERVQNLQAEREAELVKCGVKVEAHHKAIFGNMSQDAWDNFINGAKLNREAVKQAELKAAQDKKEAERKQAEEHELMKKENERLKVESQKLEAERQKREAEQEKFNAEQRERVYKLNKERAEVERLEKQIQKDKLQQQQAREAQERQVLEAKRKRALAPDKEKLIYFADALEKKKDTLESKEGRGAMLRAASVLRDEAGKLG